MRVCVLCYLAGMTVCVCSCLSKPEDGFRRKHGVQVAARNLPKIPEFKLQMQIPEMLCDVYAYHLGEIRAWKAVQNAELFNSDQALAVGLVDESVEVEEVMARAEKHLKKQMKILLNSL